MKNKKRFKITYKGGAVYGVGRDNWAFVKKIRGGYETLHSPMACKDYIHEGIANRLHQKTINSYAPSKDVDIDLENFKIVMFFDDRENLKKHLYSVKKYINTIEKHHGAEQTKIIEVESGFKNTKAFVITAPKMYIESPALHHGLVAMLRTMHYAVKNITSTNLSKVLENLRFKDSAVLRFVITHGIYDLLVKEHTKITSGLTLKDIYPERVTNKVTSYHSGFGMVAVCRRLLASKKYSDNIIAVLEEANIPAYSN